LKRTLLAILVLLAVGLAAVAAVLRLNHASPPASAIQTPSAAGAGRPRGSVASSTSVSTAAPAPEPPETHRAAPIWIVDKAASRLSFRGVMNGEPFDGVFRDWDAQIAFDPKNLATSRATFTVQTASALTGVPIKDQALPNSEWLASAAYPQATLVTRQITASGPNRFQAAAVVHIRGIAWRTSIPFVISISHDVGRMQATMTVDRRTFGIGEGPFRSPAPVEPSVQVTMKLLARRSR